MTTISLSVIGPRVFVLRLAIDTRVAYLVEYGLPGAVPDAVGFGDAVVYHHDQLLG